MSPIALEDVKRLRLEKGDTLVLRFPAALSEYQLDQVRDEMRHAFPANPSIVLYGDIGLEVVAKSDAA